MNCDWCTATIGNDATIVQVRRNTFCCDWCSTEYRATVLARMARVGWYVAPSPVRDRVECRAIIDGQKTSRACSHVHGTAAVAEKCAEKLRADVATWIDSPQRTVRWHPTYGELVERSFTRGGRPTTVRYFVVR